MTLNRIGNARAWLSRRSVLAGLAATALMLSGASRLAFAADGSAQDFIQRIGNNTVEILNAPGATPPQKLKQLKQLLDRSTDLDLVARLIMGRHWRTANEAQRKEFLQLFNSLIMQTMAERFSWYTGETFKITGAKPIDDRDTMVSTEIIRPSGAPPIKVDWRVRKSDKDYLLIDIVAEGISMVVTQRSELNDVVSKQGVDGLLQEMRSRVAKRDAAQGQGT